jgi:spore photoproduct lyase
LRVYVNHDQIFELAQKHINQRKPEITIFEGAATSDPVPVEYLTGALARAVEFFASQETGRFRFVTKFTEIESLLPLNHRNRTEIRFSLNTDWVIQHYEHRTPSLADRIKAAAKVAKAGYPFGFLIAPLIPHSGWQEDYRLLLEELAQELPSPLDRPPTFELISHRFTARGKATILSIFPQTSLPLKEEDRQFRFGQFGYGKYLYPPATLKEIKGFLEGQIADKFPQSKILYFV